MFLFTFLFCLWIWSLLVITLKITVCLTTKKKIKHNTNLLRRKKEGSQNRKKPKLNVNEKRHTFKRQTLVTKNSKQIIYEVYAMEYFSVLIFFVL